MRKNRKAAVKRILAHGCVICGMVVVTFQILDWYNPYMDFLGHAKPVLNLLCFCSVASGFLCIFDEEHAETRVQRWSMRKGEDRR